MAKRLTARFGGILKVADQDLSAIEVEMSMLLNTACPDITGLADETMPHLLLKRSRIMDNQGFLPCRFVPFDGSSADGA